MEEKKEREEQREYQHQKRHKNMDEKRKMLVTPKATSSNRRTNVSVSALVNSKQRPSINQHQIEMSTQKDIGSQSKQKIHQQNTNPQVKRKLTNTRLLKQHSTLTKNGSLHYQKKVVKSPKVKQGDST